MRNIRLNMDNRHWLRESSVIYTETYRACRMSNVKHDFFSSIWWNESSSFCSCRFSSAVSMPIGARQTMASITYKRMRDLKDFSDISRTADNFAMRNGSKMEQLLVWLLSFGVPSMNVGPKFHYYFLTEGTEAWIDALGYMRHKQYIADKDGYRILKSKTIYVGKSPIRVCAPRWPDKRAPPLGTTLTFFPFAGRHHKRAN